MADAAARQEGGQGGVERLGRVEARAASTRLGNGGRDDGVQPVGARVVAMAVRDGECSRRKATVGVAASIAAWPVNGDEGDSAKRGHCPVRLTKTAMRHSEGSTRRGRQAAARTAWSVDKLAPLSSSPSIVFLCGCLPCSARKTGRCLNSCSVRVQGGANLAQQGRRRGRGGTQGRGWQ